MLALIAPFVARDRTAIKFSTAIKLFHVPAAKNSFFTQILTQFFCVCSFLLFSLARPTRTTTTTPRGLCQARNYSNFFCSAFK